MTLNSQCWINRASSDESNVPCEDDISWFCVDIAISVSSEVNNQQALLLVVLHDEFQQVLRRLVLRFRTSIDGVRVHVEAIILIEDFGKLGNLIQV